MIRSYIRIFEGIEINQANRTAKKPVTDDIEEMYQHP
jgi:hypothetical protein